jgi:hypothetical protein
MAEIILPGTYITVRDEGLITAGRVATGNIGIVGTAAKGPVKEVVTLGSFSEAREIFGEPDEWVDGTKNELTLIRALEFTYNNGGRAVYAVRTAAGDPAKSAYQTKDGTAANLTKLEARTAGTWGDQLEIEIATTTDNAFVEEELPGDAAKLRRSHVLDGSLLNSIQLRQRTTGLTRTYDIIYEGEVDNSKPQVKIDPATGVLTFTTLASHAPTVNDTLVARYEVPAANARRVELGYQGFKERYIVADAAHLAEQINRRSTLISATTHEADFYDKLPVITAGKLRFGSNDAEGHTAGSNGEAATATDYQNSLTKLEDPIVNILLLAGQDATNAGMVSALVGHINTTSDIKRERIALIGSSSTDNADAIIGQMPPASDRLIYLGPGLKLPNGRTLPGAYTAAAVAGLLSALPVQASPTNKVLNLPALAKEFNSANLEKLVQKNVLTIEKRDGFRIVKGITTATNSAWHQITTRRIVDYAIYGVRSACNPYIGKLNNDRVRGAMKATLDAFLTRMVNEEALISYEVEVTATRPQEIAGEVRVTMTLRPTFSIDFIIVTMYLG